jgi:hypothetical protein
MPLSQEEIRIRNLARYHKNKEKYNARAKEYYKNTWYKKNRTEVLNRMRLYRYNNPDLVIKNNKETRIKNKMDKLNNNIEIIKTTDRSCIVNFD